MSRKLRVLLIAEAANPDWVSVPLIGWSLFEAIAKLTDAHLVTHIRNREAVSRAGLIEGRDFTAIDNEKLAGPLWKLASLLRGGDGKGWTTVSAFSAFAYPSFERELWRLLGKRIAAGEFELVHRITPLSPTHQSPIAKTLQGHRVPFVIGPLNGGVPWPPHFAHRRMAERDWLSHLRHLYKLLPHYRNTRRYSSAILAGSQFARDDLPSWAQSKTTLIPENAIDLGRFPSIRTRSAALPLRGAFVGRLVSYKGADILLHAAAAFIRIGQLRLDIIGDGPERPKLELLSQKLGVADNVKFHGWLPHRAVNDVLSTTDFLALPSIREFGGGVVIEAMALGVAPIVADYAGPGELVGEGTGIRVSFHDEASLTAGFRNALARIIETPPILDDIGRAAALHARTYMTWEAKAAQIVKIYNNLISTQSLP